MKKKLISALTTKFEGVDAKVFERVADNILDRKTIETDDDVEAAVAEVTIQDVLTSYGDARATESARTAKRNAIKDYERRYKLKDGKRVEQRDDEDPDPNPDDDEKNDPTGVLAAMKKMFGQLEQKLDAANNEIAAMKLGKVAEARRAKVDDLIKGLTEAQRRPYARIQVDNMSEDEFKAYLEEVKGDAESMAAENAARGASFTPPIAGNAGSGKPYEPSDEEVEAVVSQMYL